MGSRQTVSSELTPREFHPNCRSDRAALIACDGFITLGLLTVWEYHYHDKNVVAGNPAKDCFSDH
jgi:hypothetical protein